MIYLKNIIHEKECWMVIHLKLINNEVVNDSTLHFFYYWRWVVMIWNYLKVLSTLSKWNKRYRLSDIKLHDKFVCENQISKFVFWFWRNSFIFFKDKQMNYNNIFIKTKPMFNEAINDFDNLLRDDICNTMKEVINMMMKEWIWIQIKLIYNSIRLQMQLNEFFISFLLFLQYLIKCRKSE